MFCSKTLDMHCGFLDCGYMSTYFLAHPDCSMSPESTIVMSVKQTALICLGEVGFHYNKTRLLQLGFSTSTSEKTMTILPWKMTSRFRQAIKYGRSHVGQDIPNGYVPNDSEVWGAPRTLHHKVMSYVTTSRQYR
jgi:hypothetical protein